MRGIGVRIHNARDHLEDRVGSVQRRHEEAAPTRRRRNCPVVVELARWLSVPGIAGDLEIGVIGDHHTIDLPSRIHRLTIVGDLKTHSRRQGQNPPRRQSVEKRHAPLHCEPVVVGVDLPLIHRRQAPKPVRHGRFGRNRLGNDTFVFRRAKERHLRRGNRLQKREHARRLLCSGLIDRPNAASSRLFRPEHPEKCANILRVPLPRKTSRRF